MAIRNRLGRKEEGFTLIELMVVVLIIAILIAIAVPTFLGARTKAQNRASQSNLRNTLVAEKTYFTDNNAFTSTLADITAIEPSLTYVAAAAPATVGSVYVDVTSGVLSLGAKSASGTCFYMKDTPTGASAGTQYSSSAACPISTDAGLTWASSW